MWFHFFQFYCLVWQNLYLDHVACCYFIIYGLTVGRRVLAKLDFPNTITLMDLNNENSRFLE